MCVSLLLVLEDVFSLYIKKHLLFFLCQRNTREEEIELEEEEKTERNNSKFDFENTHTVREREKKKRESYLKTHVY